MRLFLFIIISVTLLSVLLLINMWPRFLDDALEFPIYAYVALITIFLALTPLVQRK